MRSMKKYLALAAALCLCLLILTGCTGSQTASYTMQDVVTANSAYQLLDGHQSLLLQIQDNTRAQPQVTVYIDQDLACYVDGSSVEVFSDGSFASSYSCVDGAYQGSLYFGSYLTSVQNSFSYLTLDVQTIMSEQPESAEREGDLLVVHTKGSVQSYPVQYEDWPFDTTITSTYWLDSETLRLHKGETRANFPDGSSEVVISFQVEYDLPIPAEAQALMDRRSSAPAQRTVTVVLDAGTETETTGSITLPDNEPVTAYFDNQDKYSLYADPEFTQPYERIQQGDVTIYLKKN